MTEYETRCALCGARSDAVSVADAEAVMAVHLAACHPEFKGKVIRPAAAAAELEREAGR